MAKPEMFSHVKNSFESQENKYGYTNAKAVAQAVGDPRVERVVMRMPTKDFLYPGAKETLKTLLDEGDFVFAWTQGHVRGQLWKVANAGLGDLRKNLPYEKRDRFAVAASLDKIKDLPPFLHKLEESSIQQAIVVDDKSGNILKVAKTVDQLQKDGELRMNVNAVWINQGRTKDQVPTGFTPETFKARFKTIEDIRELLKIRPENAGKIAWLIDVDHTLLHTSAAKESMFESIASMIEEGVK